MHVVVSDEALGEAFKYVLLKVVLSSSSVVNSTHTDPVLSPVPENVIPVVIPRRRHTTVDDVNRLVLN